MSASYTRVGASMSPGVMMPGKVSNAAVMRFITPVSKGAPITTSRPWACACTMNRSAASMPPSFATLMQIIRRSTNCRMRSAAPESRYDSSTAMGVRILRCTLAICAMGLRRPS